MSGGFQVAAVIPARNGLPDVFDAVDSALGQSAPPAEVIVVDDASSDGTGEAVRLRFAERVRVLSGTFGSAAAARNAGWKAARSPWVGFLDADDLWFADKLATAAGSLAAHPVADWFFSDGAFRDLDGALFPSWLHLCADVPEGYVGSPLAELFEVNFVLTSSVVVRRAALEATRGFDESMTHAEDLDLWIRLARRGPGVASRRALVRYQHRPGGLTRQVENRLMGDVDLFDRLTEDGALGPHLRRLARRRVAMARYKLAVGALREGRNADARRHLTDALGSADRAIPVLLAWAASLLPSRLLGELRRSPWVTQRMAGPMVRGRRPVLRAGGAAPALGEGKRDRPEARA